MLLLVEDNQEIAENISKYLKSNNYQVDINYSKEDLFNNDDLSKYDLIIMDVMLEDGDGFKIFEEELIDYEIPVIFLTAKNSEEDIVRGLEIGGSDYITKPFKRGELLIRIKKILKTRKSDIIKYKDIEVDNNLKLVKENKKIIDLSNLEYKILYLLLSNLDQVITRERIIYEIWDKNDKYVNDNTVSVYIKRIRSKFKRDFIETVPNFGYRIKKD